jgi:hypothetical protein
MIMTASPVVSLMTASEARVCIQRIRDGIATVRSCLVELRDRKGWKALHYSSLRECVLAEFGLEKSQLYHELQAAEVEENLAQLDENSDISEKPPGWLPGTHAQVLADLEPEQQREVYRATTREKGEGTTAQDLLDKKIEVIFSRLSPEKQMEIINAEERDVLAQAEPKKPSATTGTFMKAQSYLGKMLTAAQKFGSTVEKFESPDPVILEEIRAGLAHFQKARELLPTLDPEG